MQLDMARYQMLLFLQRYKDAELSHRNRTEVCPHYLCNKDQTLLNTTVYRYMASTAAII